MGSSTSRALVTDPRELASEEWDYIVVGSGGVYLIDQFWCSSELCR